jgi:tetratricopeptide (TPR) repeat protein
LDKITKFKTLKERFPESEMPRWSLATLLEEAERYEEAIVEFTELVVIKPDYCVAFVHLGHCLIMEERYEEAITTLEKARTLAIDQGHVPPRDEAEMLLEQARDEMDD